MKWEEVKLGDVCVSIYDGTHQAPPKQEDGVPFITISNVDKYNKIDFTDTAFVSKEYYESIDEKRKARKGDILYTVVGSFGIPVYLKEDLTFVFQRHIAILKPSNKIDGKFLYYTMLSREFYMQADSMALGAAQRTITLNSLRNMTIKLPSLEMQNRVASILSAYDDLIENNQKQIKLLEEAAQILYKEWFIDLRFPGYENVKIVDGLPEGWEVVSIKEIAEFKRGKTITKDIIVDGNIPVIAGGVQPAYYHNVANTVAPVITVSASGANAGYTALHNIKVWASDCSFVDGNSNNIYYLFCFLKNSPETMQNLQRGSAQPHVYAKDINEIKILRPSKDVLERFDYFVNTYFNAIAVNEKMIKALNEARDRLLPKLMSGEVEV